ncbi:hypothetical protein [Adhaeribacter radiodurans]|uniref:DUF6311 domain-containing protein n=1 Tax=Adhaeribacter radiodurans TaxID=2745197 RepID=A0A7L7L230_9BACT|nr:hypothetical protein [Adhaeribacter radiodurans]QMU26823.1 hypothetical protein HUW48_01690 [Adhaeribacter radiodurans]
MRLHRKYRTLCFIILTQVLLVGVTFSPLLLHPNHYLFQINGDGAKNYFTYLAYLKQPFEQGLLKFEQFNYPFGEYLLYTDNTPIFALAVKLFSYYILDVTDHSLLLFHLFLLSGILLSSVLVYLILKRLIHNNLLIFFFSLVLPWIHPQIFRLEIGHYNLSFAFVLLITILFLLRSYQKFYSGKNIIQELYWFIPILIICSFLHLYYLPVALVFVGFFCTAWLIQAFRQQTNYKLLLQWSATALLVPLIIVYSLIRFLDGYYALRESGAGGYDAETTKLFLNALFTPYFIAEIGSFLRLKNLLLYEFGIESNAYIGSFVIGAGVLLLLARLIYKPVKTTKNQNSTQIKHFFLLFAFAALCCLCIAPGDKFHFAEKDNGINNYFNVFRYLKHVSVSFTQFRQLGRFGWFFFWFINFWIIYLYDQFLANNTRKGLAQLARYSFIGLALLDMLYIQIYYRKNLYLLTLPTTTTQDQPFLKANWKLTHFQAILPLPYYHIGCENENYYFTVDNPFFLETVQLSLRTQLPLMASNMSRSATTQVKAFYETITSGNVNPAILQKLNQKPILVAIDTSYYNGKQNIYTKTTYKNAKILFNAGRTFVQKHRLQHVGRYQNLELYSWQIKP